MFMSLDQRMVLDWNCRWNLGTDAFRRMPLSTGRLGFVSWRTYPHAPKVVTTKRSTQMRMNSSYARLREKVDALLHEFWICFTILNHDYMHSLCQTFEHVLGSWARHKLCRRKLYRHSIKTSRFVFTICVIVQKDSHCHVNNGVQKYQTPNTMEFFS